MLGAKETWPLILLSDANVLIDLYVVGGMSVVSKIAPVEVLDSVLVEVENRHQPGITEQVRAASITIVPVSDELFAEARKLEIRGLSLQDKLNLHYVRKQKRTLLTGDGRLRRICSAEGTTVFGTLWVIDEVHKGKLVNVEDLCRWLSRLSETDRFLPMEELARLRKKFGCI